MSPSAQRPQFSGDSPAAGHRLQWLDEQLASLQSQDLRRHLQTHGGSQGPALQIDGREYLNFASNDYLSLAADPRLTQAVAEAIASEGWGSGASPLVVGRGYSHQQLEARLAQFEGTEAALLFSSGFAANLGVISALMGRDDAIFSDALNHASIIDGCRLSRAEVHRYPHGDVDRLARLLEKAGGFRRRLIVTDSLFSMEGDLAPLGDLAELAERYDCLLMIDEAHATGVFGWGGRGVAEALGVERGVHIRVGTLSKALGCAGGFVCGSRSLIEWLSNRARSYVFSTAQPAATAAAGIAALQIVEQEPQRRQELLARSTQLRKALADQGWNVGPSASQIIPLLVGSASRALAFGSALRQRGLLVPAIRPPSVPKGQSRLRISVCHGHTDAMLAALVQALDECRDDA